MLSVTSDFKTTIRNNAVYSDGYVVIKDGASFNRTYTSDELNLIEIMNDIFKNDTYVGEIGQSALKLNLLGDNVGLLPLNKELTIEVYLGIKVGVSYEYVRYQDFILLEAKYNETTNFTEILGTDKLLFLNQDFTDTNTYPMTLGNYVESVVVACGLQLENKTWLNNGFILDSQPFNDVYNAREIIAKASELAMSFVVINPTTNKVDFRNFYTKLTTNTFDEELDEDEYYKLKLRDNNLGSNGVNTLVLRLSQVEGENNTVVNATNVGIDGNIEVVISDNDFINSEAKRLSVIDSMFTRIDGLKYQPLELEYRGFPYLELGDVIKVVGKNGTYYFPILEVLIKYNGGLFGTIGAEPLINTETKYRNVNTAEQRARSAEIKVDKVNGEISAIVSDIGNLDGQVSSNSAQLVIQAGQIATKVTATYVDNKIAEINSASPNRVSNLPANYDQGDIVSGVNSNSNLHIRTRLFYPISSGFVTYQIADVYEAKIILYDSSYTYIRDEPYSNNRTFNLTNSGFFKVVVRSKVLNTITVAEIETSNLKVANESSATAWNMYFGDLTLEQQRDLYTFKILSRTGLTFDETSSTLQLDALVLLNNVDVTDLMVAQQFAWTRVSKNATLDSQFNALGITGKTLTITSTYLDRSATYMCLFTISESAYLVTKFGNRILTKASNHHLLAITTGGD